MTEELKPCPFCGGTETGIGRYESRRWVVQCYSTDCICEGPHRATKREAIAAWNHRADLAIPKDEADAMVAAAYDHAASVAGMTDVPMADTLNESVGLPPIGFQIREAILKATPAGARSALDWRVQEAVKAERENFTNCAVCGRVIDKREPEDGGDDFGAQMFDGRWVCSVECEEAAIRAQQEPSE